MADRIGVAPEPLRRRLADDDDQRRAGRRIGVGEVAAAQHRNVHRLEEAGRHHSPVCRDRGLRRQRRRAGGRDRRLRVRPVAERDTARRAGSAHAWCRSQRLEQRAIEHNALLDRIFRARQRDLEGQQTIGLKPEADVLQAQQALGQQPGPDQQNRRERELHGGEAVAQAWARTARRARHLFQDLVQVGLRRMERRRDAEQQTGRDRQHQREQQHRRVDADFGHRQQVRRHHRVDRVHTPERREQSHGATDRRQHQTFDEQLTQQPSAAGADGGADGDLFLPRGRAREQQVRDIRGRDQQHAADRAQQHDEPGLQLRVHEEVVEIHQLDSPLLRLRILLAYVSRDDVHLGLGLLERRAGP